MVPASTSESRTRRFIARAITAVLAVGLLAGSSAGVAAQDVANEASEAAVFTWARVADVDTCDPTGVPYSYDENSSGRESTRGLGWCHRLEADDPRVSGLYTQVENVEAFGISGGIPEVWLAPFSLRGVNDGGSWSGSGHYAAASSDGDPVGSVWFAMLLGEGEYEGLAAILGGDAGLDEGWGVLVPAADLPPIPEPLDG